MGYTLLDCFLCTFNSQADNSLSKKKGEMFVQLIFMFTLCTQISNRVEKEESYFQLPVFLLFMEILKMKKKALDLKQNTKMYNAILLIN